MSDTTTFEELLLTRGISLQELGLREVGLFRAEALHAVELLRALSVPILGGDVYFMSEAGLEQAFANWHIEPHPDEGRLEYAERSCRQTTKYIEAFPHRLEVTPVFVLVVPPVGQSFV